jgi:hypothetical protein
MAGLPELEARIVALEERIGVIEGRQAAAIVGARREFDAVRENRRRDSWLASLRRR